MDTKASESVGDRTTRTMIVRKKNNESPVDALVSYISPGDEWKSYKV